MKEVCTTAQSRYTLEAGLDREHELDHTVSRRRAGLWFPAASGQGKVPDHLTASMQRMTEFS